MDFTIDDYGTPRCVAAGAGEGDCDAIALIPELYRDVRRCPGCGGLIRGEHLAGERLHRRRWTPSRTGAPHGRTRTGAEAR